VNQDHLSYKPHIPKEVSYSELLKKQMQAEKEAQYNPMNHQDKPSKKDTKLTVAFIPQQQSDDRVERPMSLFLRIRKVSQLFVRKSLNIIKSITTLWTKKINR
jgi:hypothetical protein